MVLNPRAIGIPLIWILVLVPPAVIAAVAPIKDSEGWKRKKPAFAPPAVVFPIAWTFLYIAAATALMLQVFWPSAQSSPALQWTAVALVSAQLVMGYAWPFLWRANNLRGATLLIVAMLACLTPGIVLTTRINVAASALWSVMAVWLAFALTLSAATASHSDTYHS